MKKTLAALLLSAFALTASGCFGKFALTRKVYGWNEGVASNKFVQSIVMWGLMIIPVYGLASFADLIIFNTIEVFTGSNPISFMHDGHEFRLARTAEDTVQVYRDGVELLQFHKQGNGLSVEGPLGHTVALGEI